MKNTALITGASSGIGKELASIHAEKGNDLIIVARREAKLLELKSELESKHKVSVMILAKDLTEPNAPKEIYDAIKEKGIEIDFLINNAGFGGQGNFHQRSWEEDSAMIQLNITALTHLCKLYLPEFIARNSGKIMNVSSVASFMPGPLQAVYFATKSYVQFLSNAISEEISDTNVTVTNLMPGATETEFSKTANLDNTTSFENTANARKVAEEGYNAMLQGKMDVISGLGFSQKIQIKLLPFVPKKIQLKMIKKIQTKK